MDPLDRFKADRNLARDAKDPMANLCTVASLDNENVELRTLVLRDVGADLAIFINATSPKWAKLQEGGSVLTYWPSVQIQYRLQVRTTPVPTDVVAESWQLRPDAPKRMDWFYTRQQSQSTDIGSRDRLLDEALGLDLPDPLVAPDTARGLLLRPYKIERLDLTQDNGIHDRTLYEESGDAWTTTTLVP